MGRGRRKKVAKPAAQVASEAAFTGKPPAEGWSEAGKRVYWGLVAAMKERDRKLLQVAVGSGQYSEGQ